MSIGEKIVVFLNMSAQNLSPVMSRNTIAEIKGREYPDQVNNNTFYIENRLTYLGITSSEHQITIVPIRLMMCKFVSI